LGNWTKGPDRSFTKKCLSFGEKIVKIGPVDPEIIGFQEFILKINKLMQGKSDYVACSASQC